MAMFLSMPSALRSKHSPSSSVLYAFRWTKVVLAPGVLRSNSIACQGHGRGRAHWYGEEG